MGISSSAFRVATHMTGWALLLLSATAQADNIADKLAQAQAKYQASRQVPAQLDQVIAEMKDAVAKADDAEQKYDASVLLSMAYYFKGTHLLDSDSDGKKTVHLQGVDACQVGIDVAKASLGDQRAECYYFKSVNLGRWGLANGRFHPETIRRRHEYRRGLIDTINVRRSESSDDVLKGSDGKPVSRITKAGEKGATYEGYGAARALGRMYYSLPPMFGKDLALSEQMLREAVAAAPTFAINQVYLAETLWDASKQEEARGILRKLIAGNEGTFNPDRVPETHDDFAEARRLLSAYGE